MKQSGIIIIAIVLVILTIAYISLTSGATDEEYKAGMVADREQKDGFMRTSDESPFAKDPSAFNGLKYFDTDPAFRIQARVEQIVPKKVVVLSTSTGESTSYLEYAWAIFEWQGAEYKLLLLEVMAMGPTRGSIILAFADATSAKETYGAGRYLDVKKVPGAGTLTLDFNKAYNPYCAYVDDYSCPFPPTENILSIAVRAGEKTYH